MIKLLWLALSCMVASAYGFYGNYGNQDLYAGWGYGGYGQDGCLGTNCGYWDGCPRKKCSGFYDFRTCAEPMCMSGPYRGYGCNMGNCQYVCHRGKCHSTYGYGHGCDGDHCGMPYADDDCYSGRCKKGRKTDDNDDKEWKGFK